VRLEALAAFVPLARSEHAARLTALASAGDAARRRLAIFALGRALGTADARERALSPLLSDADREVRAMAALALGGLSDAPLGAVGRRAAEAAMDDASTEGPLLAWAFARTVPDRVAARFAVPGIHASPLVLLALARTADAGAARSVALALLEPGSRDAAVRAFRSALILDDEALAVPGESASDLLLRALGVRPVDSDRLSHALSDVVPAALCDRTDEGRPSARARAALRLLVPATGGAPGLLCDGVSDPDGPRLSQTFEAATAEPLEALASDDDVEIRMRATALLAAGMHRNDVGLFERALSDPAPGVLRVALEARAVAGTLGDLRPLVERALAHTDWSVRRSAAEALAREPGTEAALVRAADDPYALVRDAALRALGTRTPRSAEAEAVLIRACQSDVEERVRALAARFVDCD
jgi:hypothetical protein